MLSWYDKATQQAGISHALHILGGHSVVTASFATYLTHTLQSSITKEAAAMMHPDTSIMNGSQACSCTVCSKQQAVCGFQLPNKQAGFMNRPSCALQAVPPRPQPQVAAREVQMERCRCS